MPLTRIQGKRQMRPNRNEAARAGVVQGLQQSGRPEDRIVASLVPKT